MNASMPPHLLVSADENQQGSHRAAPHSNHTHPANREDNVLVWYLSRQGLGHIVLLYSQHQATGTPSFGKFMFYLSYSLLNI